MSLYFVQKLIYELNRSEAARRLFERVPDELFNQYDLTEEEKQALTSNNIGLLYVMGVNGQLLMHFAAYRGLSWDDYIQAMKDGLQKHGGVRAGLYAAVNQGEGGAV